MSYEYLINLESSTTKRRILKEYEKQLSAEDIQRIETQESDENNKFLAVNAQLLRTTGEPKSSVGAIEFVVTCLTTNESRQFSFRQEAEDYFDMCVSQNGTFMEYQLTAVIKKHTAVQEVANTPT